MSSGWMPSENFFFYGERISIDFTAEEPLLAEANIEFTQITFPYSTLLTIFTFWVAQDSKLIEPAKNFLLNFHSRTSKQLNNRC